MTIAEQECHHPDATMPLLVLMKQSAATTRSAGAAAVTMTLVRWLVGDRMRAECSEDRQPRGRERWEQAADQRRSEAGDDRRHDLQRARHQRRRREVTRRDACVECRCRAGSPRAIADRDAGDGDDADLGGEQPEHLT